VTNTGNFKEEKAVPHCTCNTDGTKTDGTRSTAGKPYRKQRELKYTFRTEQWNSSLLTAM
jgi:hypothetical protein